MEAGVPVLVPFVHEQFAQEARSRVRERFWLARAIRRLDLIGEAVASPEARPPADGLPEPARSTREVAGFPPAFLVEDGRRSLDEWVNPIRLRCPPLEPARELTSLNDRTGLGVRCSSRSFDELPKLLASAPRVGLMLQRADPFFLFTNELAHDPVQLRRRIEPSAGRDHARPRPQSDYDAAEQLIPQVVDQMRRRLAR